MRIRKFDYILRWSFVGRSENRENVVRFGFLLVDVEENCLLFGFWLMFIVVEVGIFFIVFEERFFVKVVMM